MNETAGKILIEGNAAAAIGCMMAGVTVVAWYPITPSSSLCESLIGYMKKYRIDKATGKATFAIVQAEDEIASLGMVIGASWAGARAMTATAGPGISLMSEFAGLAYYAETPAVIFDVQRVGPSTGLPTRTAQGDLLFTALPLARRHEAHHDHSRRRSRSATRWRRRRSTSPSSFQTPVFVMMDLDLGMNNWMSDGFKYPDKPINRGKLLTPGGAEAARRVGPLQGRGRRRHSVPHGARRRHARLLRARIRPQREGPVQRAARRLRREHGSARAQVRDGARVTCRSRSIDQVAGAKIGFIGYGTSHWAITESRDQLREETDVKTSYFRLRAYPFTEELAAFIDAHERVYVIEQNRDAQLLQLMQLELTPERIAKLRSVLHYNGLPIDARSITDDVLAQEGFEVAKKTVAQVSAGIGGRRIAIVEIVNLQFQIGSNGLTWRHHSK